MPSKSMKQHKLMEAVAHGWKPKGARNPPVPINVAQEFVKSDKKIGLINYKPVKKSVK